jgi:hypothetical protein
VLSSSDQRSAHHRRGREAERGCGLRPALLRGQGPDRLRACGLGTPALPARGSAPDRVHRLRAADRPDARGDQVRARQAPRRPRAEPQRLVASLGQLDVAHRRADLRTRAAARGTHRVHRVRLPLTRPLPARQPGRSRRPLRTGTALLGRGPQAGLVQDSVEQFLRVVRRSFRRSRRARPCARRRSRSSCGPCRQRTALLRSLRAVTRAGRHCVGRIDPLDLRVHQLPRDRFELPPRVEDPLDGLLVRRDAAGIPLMRAGQIRRSRRMIWFASGTRRANVAAK